MRNGRILWSLIGAFFAPAFVFGQTIPAFPGAEGPGAISTGGRPNQFGGGIVYHVTTLAADHPTEPTIVGSLRYGLKNERFLDAQGRIIPRTIVFDVGGAINLNSNDWDFRVTNVTIAGQTAPGSFTLLNGEYNPGGDNSIMRNFSVRRGGDTVNEKDAIWLNGTNTIVDHVTASWQTDEGISVTDGQNNMTVQYAIISEGISHADGGDGSSIEGATPNAKSSFHHNLYAHNKSRLPRRGEKEGPGDILDFRNNVVYDWTASSAGTGPSSSEPSFTNFVNNYYIRGVGNGQNVMNSAGPIHQIYQSGNLRDINRDGVANGLPGGNNGWDYFLGSETQMSAPFSVPHNVTQAAEDALQTVLNYSGANWWTRNDVVDTTDERIISQVKTYGNSALPVSAKGQVITAVPSAEWDALMALATDPAPFSRPSDWDTESMGFYPDPDGTGSMVAPQAPPGDGMPTWWEVAHELDPNVDDHNGDFDGDGYRNLEEYINDVAAWPAPFDIVFTGGTNSRYEQITNWSITQSSPGEANTTTNWQPSRFDTAIIDNGTVTVDAVGQHAGNLLLATNPSDNATLNITSGWLKVEDAPQGLSDGAVVIGNNAAATAALNLSGGKLITKTLVKGDGGSFNFTGGVLSAETVGFDLVNNGGTIAPGASPGMTHVMGDLTLNSGVLEIEIGGTDWDQYDRVVADGVAYLGGTLRVELVDLDENGPYVPQLGDLFGFLVSAGTDGMFDDFDLPGLADGLAWAILPGDATTFLAVVEAVGLAGDYNDDGVVDAADYTVWRDHFGGTALPFNETASLGSVDNEDYDAWKANFGATDGGGAGSSAAVPEPSTAILMMAALTLLIWRTSKFAT